MMDEYIKRDAAIKAFHDKYGPLCSQDALFAMLVTLHDVPAADVVARDCYDRLIAENDRLRKERPVRHGRWILKDDGRAHCSECDTAGNSYVWHYCPNCGTRMDGKDRQDE